MSSDTDTRSGVGPAATARTSEPAARRLAAFAAALDASAIPTAIVDVAKLHLLDALGVALAAASLRTRPRIERAIAALGHGAEATGIGVSRRMPAPSAALLNGSLMHALEFDDTHLAAVVHASAVVAPAALAVAERERRTGAALMTAFVLGWEVLARVGLAAPGAFQARGFQSTAVAGAPVAALVAASLGGLDVAHTTHAMGIAGSQASGIFEFVRDGTTVKMLHGGWPAHAGILAAALAREGLTGPATVFEGERGLFRAFTDDPECATRFAAELDDLGARWLIAEASFKLFPCCHYLQAAIECTQRLLADAVAAEDIVRIECELPAEVAWLVCEPWADKLGPPSGHVAKFSLPYCLAAAIVDGQVDVATFDRCAPDMRLRPMMERIVYRPMAASGFPRRYPARVRIETRDGRTHAGEVTDVHGSPARPFTPEQVQAKFRRNAARALEPRAVEVVIQAMADLDSASSLAALTTPLRAAQPGKTAS